MADLNLSGQTGFRNTIAPHMQTLKSKMDERKIVWDRLPDSKKKKWVLSGKDPIMTLSWQMYRYLRDNFFGEDVDNA